MVLIGFLVEGIVVDGPRFDHLSRRIAGSRSRRQLLKTIGGMVAAAVTGSTAAAQTCTAHYSSCSDDGQCCAGSVCEHGLCMPGCRIDGVFINAWSSAPDNICVQCRPEITTTTWTPVNEGLSCWSGDPAAGTTYCQNGTCAPNVPATCPPPPPCHTDQLVDPSTCTYAIAEAGTPCGNGPMCHGGFAQPADVCDGDGFCIGGGSNVVGCAPYQCQGDHCATTCETDGDCVGGAACCSGRCVSFDTIEHCGTCGNACPTESGDVCLGEAICTNGACGFAPRPAGAPCRDDDGCNGNEACDGEGTCVPGLPVVCPACTICIPESGLCEVDPELEGAACGTGQTCCSGSCITFGTLEHCTGCGDACSEDMVCDPVRGCVECLTVDDCNVDNVCAAVACTNGVCITVDDSETCGTFNFGCGGVCGGPGSLCSQTVDRGSVCVSNAPCHQLPACVSTTDCPDGFVCGVGGCCAGEQVCVPTCAATQMTLTTIENATRPTGSTYGGQ